MLIIGDKRTIKYQLVLKACTMVKTKGLAATQANWEGAIGTVPARYAEGIKQATDVINKAIMAEDNYAAGVQRAVSTGARVKGLQKISDADWQAAALAKGAPRIAQGMTEAKAKFGSGMGKVLAIIEGVTIAEKTQDVAANVTNRVLPIAMALRNAKEQGNL